MSLPCLCIIVPKELVKTVKSKLERDGALDKKVKITPYQLEENSQGRPTHFLISTLITQDPTVNKTPDEPLGRNQVSPTQQKEILDKLGLLNDANNVTVALAQPGTTQASDAVRHVSQNPVHRAISSWLQNDVSINIASMGFSIENLLSSFPVSYVIYDPMLLLPPHSFKADQWSRLLSSIPASDMENLYKKMAEVSGTTHVAMNAPIPPSNDTNRVFQSVAPASANLNILRSPTHLQPLNGFFGPRPTIQSLTHPTREDFSSALWVSVTQSGIHQTWAPLYTMFSRGNMKEKSRLLYHQDILSMRYIHKSSGGRWTAVDLYAGIGYFAFSYAKAGASDILCWEINPWSVEGMRRGAVRNKWEFIEGKNWYAGVMASQAEGQQDSVSTAEDPRFVVFQESNVHAAERIEALRKHIPPVSHVNLGLLPTSAGAYEVAVRAVDPVFGGYLHVHENIPLDPPEMDKKVNLVVGEILALVKTWRSTEDAKPSWTVRLENVQHVKTYAPGVVHCVLDISVKPPS